MKLREAKNKARKKELRDELRRLKNDYEDLQDLFKSEQDEAFAEYNKAVIENTTKLNKALEVAEQNRLKQRTSQEILNDIEIKNNEIRQKRATLATIKEVEGKFNDEQAAEDEKLKEELIEGEKKALAIR